jgi:hypothetical protein
VFVPRLIIVVCSIAEGAENAFQIVVIFESNVLFNNGDTSPLPVN